MFPTGKARTKMGNASGHNLREGFELETEILCPRVKMVEKPWRGKAQLKTNGTTTQNPKRATVTAKQQKTANVVMVR